MMLSTSLRLSLGDVVASFILPHIGIESSDITFKIPILLLMYFLLFICRLVDTFPEFLEQEQMDVPGLGTKFRGSMPKSITLSHVVDVWKKIVMNGAQPADK